MDYRQLMNGAGLGDVLIPKKEFVKEHERLVALLNQSDIPALRREAKEQKAELAERGGSGKSNFIARMMAEAKLKHASPEERKAEYHKENKYGSYVRGSVMDPDEPEDMAYTRMSRADKFDYNALATANQSKDGQNKKGNPYGASPFIAYHFGQAQSKPRESEIQKQSRDKWRKKPASALRVEDEEEEEEEKKDSYEKRVASREAYKQRKSERRLSDKDVLLPESKKRKERRDKQSARKKLEDERRRAEMSENEVIRDKEQQKAERAKKNREPKASEPKAFISAADKEPRSRPSNTTKADWLRYIDSRQYRELLEQRAFNARQEAQQRAFRMDD